jgi:hypothetical protein
MNQPIFYFDEYVVRPVAEKDREYLTHLITSDPYHHDCMDADFFLHLLPGEDAWAIEDRKGNALLYFKTQTAVRLSLQFTEQTAEVNRRVLGKGMAWIEAMLIQNRFREIIFNTMGPELKAMAKRRLGFKERAVELVRMLGVPNRPATPPSGLGTTVQQYVDSAGGSNVRS